MQLAVFLFVYLGMILGRIPGLALDRTGVALLGAIALTASGRMDLDQAVAAIDAPTMALLFGLMVVSAQFRLGGFYTRITRATAQVPTTPARLLGLTMAVAGGLSALLANDIVCLAMTPILAEACIRRGLDPIPFLLGLACAANIGSAATLIGNPQNMLIGETLAVPFAWYAARALPPSLAGLAAAWGIIALVWRGRWEKRLPEPPPVEAPAFDAHQTRKGLAVLAGTVLAFLFAPWPRPAAALAGAGVLLTSRRMASRSMLGLIDWNLLLLFAGLFVVNRGLADSGLLDQAAAHLAAAGLDPAAPGLLYPVAAVLSNLISNVPAVMLLLPFGQGPEFGLGLALSSTLAGNLLLVGSIANLIVAEQASRLGVAVTWRIHAAVGLPVTLATLILARLLT